MQAVYLHTGAPLGSALKVYGLLQQLLPGEYSPALRPTDRLAVCRGDRTGHAAQCIAAGVPYVLVMNDSDSMRRGVACTAEERAMAEGAKCILYGCESLRHYHRAQGLLLPPHTIVANRPLAAHLDFQPLPKIGGLVYAGGLAGRGSRPVYRRLQDTFARLVADGHTVHVYSQSLTAAWAREEYGMCVLHDPLPYPELLHAMSQYAAGLLALAPGDTPAHRYAQAAGPNKLYDYLAAGLPAWVVDGPRAAYALPWCAPYPEPLPVITEAMRHSQVIETDKRRVTRLLREAL